MFSVNPSNSINTNEFEFSSNLESISQSGNDNTSIFARLHDTDGIIQDTDIQYSVEGVESDAITAWFKAHSGKWTAALKAEIDKLIIRFNMEQEVKSLRQNFDNGVEDLKNAVNKNQGSYNDFVNQAKTEFENFKKDFGLTSTKNVSETELPEEVDAEQPVQPPTTGDVVAVQNEDGTSYQINVKDHTITKYDTDGNVIELRAMTQEEQALPTQELINQLQAPPAPAQSTEVVVEQPVQPPTVRQIQGNGITGSYTIAEAENGGYTLNQQFTVSTFRNQAAQAFSKGLTDDFGMVNVHPDDNGQYNFRGIKATTPSVLSMKVQSRSQQIAGYTAIYQDLQARKSSGEALTAGEEKFMLDYNKLLQQSGLQMNSNGELEDIPAKTKGRSRR